jgi:putative OPT family oligopeptide transporter
MLQDLKVGYILGGTPRRMQIGDILGVLVASAALYFPLLILHQGDINAGGIGFGGRSLPAPQAGLMASLAQGIVGGQMAWPLVGVGILMGFSLILVEVRSPMLFAVGMYLPFETVSAIFVGGVIRWVTDQLRNRRGFNDAQKARVENAGVLTASGLIAGEAMMGLVIAAFRFREIKMPSIFPQPSFIAGMAVMLLLAAVMVKVPLANAGRPEDPAPPTAVM